MIKSYSGGSSGACNNGSHGYLVVIRRGGGDVQMGVIEMVWVVVRVCGGGDVVWRRVVMVVVKGRRKDRRGVVVHRVFNGGKNRGGFYQTFTGQK